MGDKYELSAVVQTGYSWACDELNTLNDALTRMQHESNVALEKQRADPLNVEIIRLKKTLVGIFMIKHKTDGGDWDEIEEAQSIAAKALEGEPCPRP